MEGSEYQQAHGEYVYEGVTLSRFFQPIERVNAGQAYTNWRKGDLVLKTFPKSGTNFCMFVYQSILVEAGLATEDVVNHCPLEIEASPEKQRREQDPGRVILQELEELPSPRLIVSHIPFKLLPEAMSNGHLKVINVRRNPKDVAISMFNFWMKLNIIDKDLPFCDFLENFINGNSDAGSQYFLHLRDWYKHRNEPHMLNIQFEDMVKDLPAAVRSIAEFADIQLTDEQIRNVVQKNQFETRLNIATEYQRLFLRQGKKGGWKSVLTVAQNERLDKWIKEEMKGMEDVQFQYE